MRIKTALSLTALRRALGTGQVVRQRDGEVQLYVLHHEPDQSSPTWQEGQSAMSRAADLWKQFAPEQRAAWTAYARRHERLLRKDRKVKGPGGRELYTAAVCRLLELGLDPGVSSPHLPPPLPLTELRLEPWSGDPREFSFTVEHPLAAAADHLVAVRLTPPTRGPGRAPRQKDARLIAGRSPESTRPLPASGATLLFPNARFAVEPGQRFGVWAQVLRRSDGMASRPLTRDFDRG